MKTKEELNAIKKEVEAVRKKLAELNEEELVQVTGGLDVEYDIEWKKQGDDVEDPTKPGEYFAPISLR